MVSSSSEIIDNYFDLLESTLLENDLCDMPCQIFNVGESGMSLDPPSLKVVTKLGVKHSQAVSTGCKTNITVVACCSTAGAVIPPMVIFDRKTLNPKLAEGELSGTFYGLSKMDGLTQTSLTCGLQNIFLLMLLQYVLSYFFSMGIQVITSHILCTRRSRRTGNSFLLASTHNTSHSTSGQGMFWST